MGIEEIPGATYQPEKKYIWQLMIQSVIVTTITFVIYNYLAPTNIFIAWVVAVLLGWFVPVIIYWFRHMP